MVNIMPSKPPIVFPQEQRLLSAFGERLRLARLRRKLSMVTVAQRAGVSRTSLYNAEAGDPGATLGTYLRILAVLGLETDIQALAADDKVGRKLQDLALEPGTKRPALRSRSSMAAPREGAVDRQRATGAEAAGLDPRSGTGVA